MQIWEDLMVAVNSPGTVLANAAAVVYLPFKIVWILHWSRIKFPNGKALNFDVIHKLALACPLLCRCNSMHLEGAHQYEKYESLLCIVLKQLS